MKDLSLIKETMSSIEIAELTGKLHKDVLEAIRVMEPAWEKVSGRKFPLVDYTDKKGEKRPCYELNKTECLYVATKFNDEARAKLVLRWEELENEKQEERMSEPKQSKPMSDSTLYGLRMRAISWASKLLNLSEVSKLEMMKAVTDPLGLPSPDYVPSEGVKHSATYLLKEKGVKLKTEFFNLKMEEKGYLVQKERPSRSKGTSLFWNLTEKGLVYGANDEHYKSKLETQPHYYDNKFGELLSILGITNNENN